jgi:endonuclease IV
VAVCYDTAHGFEAGLIKEHTPESVKKLFDEFEKYVGCKRIVAVHANDSKTEFESHHDRHENIGQGFIGKDAFIHLAAEKHLAHTHWFLEVPGYDNLGPDKKNVDILKACRA